MFRVKSLCASAALLAALSTAPFAHAEELSDTGDFIDGVAAIVNEGIVLKSQYEDTLAMIKTQAAEVGYELPPPDILRDQVLDRVILTEIQLQRAEMFQLSISDEQLNRVIANLAAERGIEFTDLPVKLAEEGIDYQMFRRQMREDILLQQLRQHDVIRRIPVTDREIQNCIQDLENNAVINSDYNLSHIRLNLPDSATADEVNETIRSADEIVARARDGADFSQLAARYSASENALQGGQLGWLEGEQVPTIFTEILAPLAKGDVSDPFRTRNSLHIVKVNDMRGALERSEETQVHVRHILIMPNEIIDEETAKQRLEDAVEAIRNGEDFGEQAKLLSDDPSSANEGGEMPWAGPGTYVPEFQEEIDKLQPGEMSPVFRSRFGYHLAELLGRRVYDNTEERKTQNCDQRIRNSKVEEETALWMQRIRDEAYVDVRM
ncbi:MAG: peptidylprolyl isomerase [Woeseiaceae bacterium]